MPDKTTPHIKRAARAICAEDQELGFPRWDILSPREVEIYHKRAQSALSTTREPSEAEIEAAAEALHDTEKEICDMVARGDPRKTISAWSETPDAARDTWRIRVRDALIAAARVRVGE